MFVVTPFTIVKVWSWVSVNRWVGKEDVIHIHTHTHEILLSYKTIKFDVWQEPTQFYKVIILRLKNK